MNNKIKIQHIGIKKSYRTDLYYNIIKNSWFKFFLYSTIIYLILNLVFALIYYFSPAEILNAKPHSLWDAFIFSFQTSSTLGYGYLLPKSKLAHMIVMIDTLIGIFYVAIITGLAFAKFARPTAKILFSDKIILSIFDGIPTIMFRLGNIRDTHIVDANLNVAVLLPYVSKEGLKMRRFYNLPLVSNNNPTFNLSWTAMHQINNTSPIYGINFEKLKKLDIMFFISFTGIDDILSQSIHANYRYLSKNFFKSKKFVDVLSIGENHAYTVDFNKFHLIEEFED